MWHEARKQEKKIRGMLVDYKKRAERRKEYYERIKQDPTQFIQIHGRSCKIHLDPAIHYAAEAPGSMMPWRGDKESMIDRFDVRAHLDDIPSFDRNASETTTPEQLWEERQSNYERYRILIQNEFLGIKEEKFLNQIRLEELFGPVGNKTVEEEKKSLMPKRAAIGFVYDGPPGVNDSTLSQQGWPSTPTPTPTATEEAEEDSGDDSDSDIDLDLTVDVLSLTNQQQRELNSSGVEYGLNTEDFMDLMSRDLEEAEALRIAKEHEDEKAMYSGRKSRKERRALKKKHLDRNFSPPSYAARSSPTYGPYHRLSSKSHSRSPSPPTVSQIKFITSFGEDSEAGHSDGEGGVIIIPEAEGASKPPCSSQDRRKATSSSTSSAARRSKHRRRSSTSSRERSRSTSRTTYRRRRSSSKRRSRSRSRGPRSGGRDRHGSGRYRRRTRSRTRSESKSTDRWKHKRHVPDGKSESQSQSRSKSRSRSRSKSSIKNKKDLQTMPKQCKKVTTTTQPPATEEADSSSAPKLPSPPRRRYYGRRAENSDSDDAESGGENGDKSNLAGNASNETSHSLSTGSTFGNDPTADKGSGSAGGAKLTPQERLRKKMQALLKKQYKADKKLEKERAVKAEQERQDREDELREIAIKLRRRERERRHRLHGEESNSEDSVRSRSRSNSRSPRRPKSRSDGRYRDSGYDRDRDRENDGNRIRDRGRDKDSRERDTRRYMNRSRSRDRERDRQRDRDREKYRSRENISDRDTRRGRDENQERDRGDRRSNSDRYSKGYADSGQVSKDERIFHKRKEDSNSTDQSDDAMPKVEERKIRLVDY